MASPKMFQSGGNYYVRSPPPLLPSRIHLVPEDRMGWDVMRWNVKITPDHVGVCVDRSGAKSTATSKPSSPPPPAVVSPCTARPSRSRPMRGRTATRACSWTMMGMRISSRARTRIIFRSIISYVLFIRHDTYSWPILNTFPFGGWGRLEWRIDHLDWRSCC